MSGPFEWGPHFGLQAWSGWDNGRSGLSLRNSVLRAKSNDMNMNRYVFLLCVIFGLVGCSGKKSDPKSQSAAKLDHVVLMLNWYPEAEHGGFYAAKVNGIYEQYGLDVEIRPGGPNAPVAQELLSGRVEFAVGNADDVLLFRQQEAPIVALMAPMQNTPRCILVREESAITDLKSLAGMTLQANVGRPFLDFMKSKGLLEGVQVVPYNGSVVQLVTDSKTAIQAYSFSEPLTAEQQGVKVRKLMLSDIGFNPYASCLIATEKTIANERDIVSRMVLASRDGWQKYFESPESTNREILANNPEGMTIEALEFGVAELLPLCVPAGMSADAIGVMSAERWTELVDQFVKLELVDSAKVKADEVFTSDFLDRSAPTE
jgi:NitT/TauT family transport system substrate-binding protein